ncbi:hypothetical protein DFJ74DRAFT_686508 [Hyaloraphidium curvatum]|nr:hypothetical protein DFJ74DRAFT_686508 [Hyaloraphidium curvatum]
MLAFKAMPLWARLAAKHGWKPRGKAAPDDALAVGKIRAAKKHLCHTCFALDDVCYFVQVELGVFRRFCESCAAGIWKAFPFVREASKAAPAAPTIILAGVGNLFSYSVQEEWKMFGGREGRIARYRAEEQRIRTAAEKYARTKLREIAKELGIEAPWDEEAASKVTVTHSSNHIDVGRQIVSVLATEAAVQELKLGVFRPKLRFPEAAFEAERLRVGHLEARWLEQQKIRKAEHAARDAEAWNALVEILGPAPQLPAFAHQFVVECLRRKEGLKPELVKRVLCIEKLLDAAGVTDEVRAGLPGLWERETRAVSLFVDMRVSPGPDQSFSCLSEGELGFLPDPVRSAIDAAIISRRFPAVEAELGAVLQAAVRNEPGTAQVRSWFSAAPSADDVLALLSEPLRRVFASNTADVDEVAARAIDVRGHAEVVDVLGSLSPAVLAHALLPCAKDSNESMDKACAAVQHALGPEFPRFVTDQAFDSLPPSTLDAVASEAAGLWIAGHGCELPEAAAAGSPARVKVLQAIHARVRKELEEALRAAGTATAQEELADDGIDKNALKAFERNLSQFPAREAGELREIWEAAYVTAVLDQAREALLAAGRALPSTQPAFFAVADPELARKFRLALGMPGAARVAEWPVEGGPAWRRRVAEEAARHDSRINNLVASLPLDQLRQVGSVPAELLPRLGLAAPSLGADLMWRQTVARRFLRERRAGTDLSAFAEAVEELAIDAPGSEGCARCGFYRSKGAPTEFVRRNHVCTRA